MTDGLTPLKRLPLSQRAFFASRNIDDTQDMVSRIFKTHDQKCLGGTNLFDARLHRLSFKDTSLVYIQYGSNVEVDPGPLSSFYLVHMPVSGSSLVSFGRGNIETTSSRAVVCSPDIPFRFRWTPDCGVLAIRIRRDALERHFQNLTGRSFSADFQFKIDMDLTRPVYQSWLGLLRYVLDDAEQPVPLSAHPASADHFSEMIMTALLTCHPHNASDLMSIAASPAAPVYVRRAEDYMMSRLAEQMTVDELVNASGTSARSLFSGFRKFRGTSPLAYFMDLKLARAHESLKFAKDNQTVSEIAMHWGFYHLGSFAQKYKKRYGELPSQTLARRII